MGNWLRDFIVILYYAVEASWLHLLWKKFFILQILRKEKSMHMLWNSFELILKKLSFLLGLLEHLGFEIYIHYGGKL